MTISEMERIRRENEALKRRLKEEERRREEETIMGFMTGRVGKKYGMWAASEMTGAGGEF